MHERYLKAINVENRAKAVNWVLKALKHVKFDAVVVRGFSGVSIGSMVAYELNKPLCFVRKTVTNCNSDNEVEYDVPFQRYVIVDDLICSGDTVKAMIFGVNQHVEKVDGIAPKCVGIALYDDQRFYEEDSRDVNYYVNRVLEKSS